VNNYSSADVKLGELLENQELNYHSIIGNDKCEGQKSLSQIDNQQPSS